MRQGEASIERSRTHATVRQFASVTAICTRRVRLYPVLHPVLSHKMLEYTLSRRRTAYIPQAHEKDFVFVIDIQIVMIIHIFMVYTTVYNIFYCISVSLCKDK